MIVWGVIEMDTKAYLRNLAEADLGAAQDNLYRAQCAAKGYDPNNEWGSSGNTLNTIITQYQAWVDRAKQALASLRVED
jgi:hypothetical protein